MRAIYVAGPFSERHRLGQVRDELRFRSFAVTSRWLDPEWTKFKDADTAVIDLEDLEAADMVLAFTEQESTRGGMMVEIGYALASGKPVVVIGPRRNNFLHLANVACFERLDQWLRTL